MTYQLLTVLFGLLGLPLMGLTPIPRRQIPTLQTYLDHWTGRYVRGEIEIEEFEAGVGELLRTGRADLPRMPDGTESYVVLPPGFDYVVLPPPAPVRLTPSRR